ncbi:MAG: hypothetical protein HYR56_34420 [Acidobacteria bacterium]|nr:hypothetical protein [Acidobacteriota bacterium]MBI3425396.1 hypothetical protein [Acidobacteriota bacterium]
MNCQDFAKTVLALAREQALDAAARAQSLAHAEVCAQCAARLAEERTLWAALHLVVAEVAREEAPARVEAALLTAFRAQAARGETPVSRMSPLHRRGGRWRLVAAWAAVILFAVLTGVVWLKSASDKQKQTAQQPPGTTASPHLPKEAPAPPHSGQVDAPKLANVPAGALRPKPRHGMRRASGNNSEEAEVVTQFFPLREGEDLAALESMGMLRVALPGSALGEVGLPVAPDSANTSVKADVVLGEDGLARAIRFVR